MRPWVRALVDSRSAGWISSHSYGAYKKALADFQNANQNNVFIRCLIGITYEKLGEKEKAMEAYREAMTARGHNSPVAFAHSLCEDEVGVKKAGGPCWI